MSYNHFNIYRENKKFRVTRNMVVYSVLSTSLTIAYASDYLINSKLETIGKYGIFIGFTLAIIFQILQYFQRKPLNGKIEGVIEFNSKAIVIDNKEFNLEDVKKIDLTVDDYLDRRELQMRGDFNQGRTNGIANVLLITFKNGESLKTNFQINYKDDFLKLRQELITYHLYGKISFLKLIHLLNIDNYAEIQEFKKTIVQ